MRKKKNAMETAMGLLSRRGHSKSELLTKLKQKGFPYKECETVISECLRLNFLDDRQFAEAYTEELKCKGMGSRRIYMALMKKGIDKELINEILERDEISIKAEYERAEKVLSGKLRSLKREQDKRKIREKAYRFLISRGFTSDIIGRLFDNTKWDE